MPRPFHREERAAFPPQPLPSLQKQSAWRLPLRHKIREGAGKWILRQVVAKYVPPALFERPKAGFGVPIDHWLRHQLRDMAYATLLSPQAIGRGYFRTEVIRRMLDEHVRGKVAWHYLLWTLLMLELWHLRFIDKGAQI